jgi:hypothetical protein
VQNFPFLDRWCVLAKTQSSGVFWQWPQNNDVLEQIFPISFVRVIIMSSGNKHSLVLSGARCI